ncbi:hypothetical protein [Halorubrum ezzemoulense]|uniref:hypothetical protein n=1 Tax=Halorubrum ezzemoulense TaxID=337243 RepID=UPI00232DA1A1|nr:hypothetical protein [Halorubrum ezzemoulense]MDB2239679.1 hypothetical protein [Halorubrum ezzemoulense]
MTHPSRATAPLEELPAEVYVWTQDVYHAPRDDGRTVCGMRMRGGRRHDAAHPPLRSRPCRVCFTEAVVEKHTPSD